MRTKVVLISEAAALRIYAIHHPNYRMPECEGEIALVSRSIVGNGAKLYRYLNKNGTFSYYLMGY